jgi:hypothetical protein
VIAAPAASAPLVTRNAPPAALLGARLADAAPPFAETAARGGSAIRNFLHVAPGARRDGARTGRDEEASCEAL